MALAVRAAAQEVLSDARRSISFALLLLVCAGFALQVLGGLVLWAAVGEPAEALSGAITGALAAGPGLEGVFQKPWTLATGAFVHASLAHLAASCAFLYFFVGPVELRLGRRGTAVLFLLGSATAFLAQNALFHGYALGSSGGILALAGAAVAACPRDRIPFFFVRSPLWVVAIVFVAVDVISTTPLVSVGPVSRAANLTHVAALGAGFVAMRAAQAGYDPLRAAPRSLRTIRRAARRLRAPAAATPLHEHVERLAPPAR